MKTGISEILDAAQPLQYQRFFFDLPCQCMSLLRVPSEVTYMIASPLMITVTDLPPIVPCWRNMCQCYVLWGRHYTYSDKYKIRRVFQAGLLKNSGENPHSLEVLFLQYRHQSAKYKKKINIAAVVKNYRRWVDKWEKKVNIYIPSLRMKVPDHLYVLGSLLLQ
jgi:hypothetical protein